MMSYQALKDMALLLSQPGPFSLLETDVVATVQNRFGTFNFRDEQTITLQPGLVGFTEYERFAMAPMPDDGSKHNFRLLQSLDEANLTFIVYPTTYHNALIDEVDVNQLCHDYSIRAEDLVLLHVVTLRQDENGATIMSLNVKAPVVINAYKQKGVQHVLASNKYATQLMLTT
jgi:flagellar assembly factor FliW